MAFRLEQDERELDAREVVKWMALPRLALVQLLQVVRVIVHAIDVVVRRELRELAVVVDRERVDDKLLARALVDELFGLLAFERVELGPAATCGCF